MATLKDGNLSFCIDFHSLDSCGDIVYAYRFLCNGINIINPQLLKDDWDWCKDGVFLTTECDFERSDVIDYFKTVIETKDGRGYESLEPPIMYIDCRAWNDFKDKRIESWKNSCGIDGHRHYSDEAVESFCKFWQEDVYMTFRIDADYLKDVKYSYLTLAVDTKMSILKKFVAELETEFKQFKKDHLEEHLTICPEERWRYENKG
jgi:hypothetical protein